MKTRSTKSVAVVGAGISGLACARSLAEHGLGVEVFEKSRGTGGRMATRRTASGLRFDHGAQYLTVRNARFRSFLKSSCADDSIRPWNARIVSWAGGTASDDESPCARYVAVPGMNAVCKELARDLPIHLKTQVAPPLRQDEKWLLRDSDDQDLGVFDFVVISAPAPQAAELLIEAPELAQKAAAVKVDPCWAAMAGFSSPLSIGFDGAFVRESPLSWIARNGSKPERDAARETWVLHASAGWTQANLEKGAEAVGADLLREFEKIAGVGTSAPVHLAAHRWRYALPINPLEERCLFDLQRQVGACGDWCGEPRVEGALLSGLAVAEKTIASL